MELQHNQTDRASLTDLGADAARLFSEANFRDLADRYGYALAFKRDIAEAIQSDTHSCLGGAIKVSGSASPTITVRYFDPKDIPFFALVEVVLRLENGGGVLIELIVTTDGSKIYATLEDINAVA